MTEWAVVGVIVVLVGLIVSIAKPLINLNGTLTRLVVLVESLQKTVDTILSDRTSCQCEWRQHNEQQDTMLQDHETRITLLENQPKTE